MLTFALSGERLSPFGPLKRKSPSSLNMPSTSLSRSVRIFEVFASKFSKASSEALVKPTIKGVFSMPGQSFCAVSYTHLRAHETDSYLVCRLLLEKKKEKVNKMEVSN